MKEFFKPTKFKVIFTVGFVATIFFGLFTNNQQDTEGVFGKILFLPLLYVSYGFAWYLSYLPNILQIPVGIIGTYALACLLDFIYKGIKRLIAKS